MRRVPASVITRPEQLATLISPVRQEILDLLSGTGAVSLSELASALGRPADGLYYHVRRLQGAGLVVPAGSRRLGRRSEALIRCAAPRFSLRYSNRDPRSDAAIVAIVSSMLRLGARDFRRAFADPANAREGPRRELWALRATGWLSPARVAEVNRRVKDLHASVSGSRKGGRLFGITVILTPLDHHARRTRSRPARARKGASR